MRRNTARRKNGRGVARETTFLTANEADRAGTAEDPARDTTPPNKHRHQDPREVEEETANHRAFAQGLRDSSYSNTLRKKIACLFFVVGSSFSVHALQARSKQSSGFVPKPGHSITVAEAWAKLGVSRVPVDLARPQLPPLDLFLLIMMHHHHYQGQNGRRPRSMLGLSSQRILLGLSL